ncbi:MAG TPA: L-threonylcarbamoyladenylate synthase [Acidimicrobiales bacterium]|nr:L-threonylcarbamoyladenylate synthase [Acidimicrobiales bacterium]
MGARSGPPRRVFPPDLDQIEDALEAGGIVAVPTDTVYGLAARFEVPEAMAALFALKGRPTDVAVPVLLGSPQQVDPLVAAWPPVAQQLSARFWPGPLTLVVAAQPGVGRLLGGDGTTVGLRFPDHHFVRSLCRRMGPVAVTSANRHGEPPCTTVDEVLATFGESTPPLALVVDGGPCDGAPSTVVDCTTDPPTCRRQGAIAWDGIMGALGV